MKSVSVNGSSTMSLSSLPAIQTHKFLFKLSRLRVTVKKVFRRTSSHGAKIQVGNGIPVSTTSVGSRTLRSNPRTFEYWHKRGVTNCYDSQDSGSLWEKSVLTLSEEDQQTLIITGPDKLDILGKVLEATEEKRELCRQGQWEFAWKGETIVVRDVVDRIVRWVDKLRFIGDVMVQYDPVNAAVPWTVFRFLLMVVVDDNHKLGAILVGLEKVANLIGRCAVYEALYLRGALDPKTAGAIERVLTELYASILMYLARAKQHLARNIGVRCMYGAFDTDGFSHLLDEIDIRESMTIKEASIAEAEYQRSAHRSLAHKISDCAEESKQLRAALAEFGGPIAGLVFSVDCLRDEAYDNERTEILRWVSEAEYQKHHWNAKEDRIDGTGEWLLRRQEFQEWQASGVSSILWLHGIPGAGKTKLTSVVVDAILQNQQSSGKDDALAYFYCKRDETGPSDPEIVLGAIVKQLSYLNAGVGSPLQKPVVEIYEARKREGFCSGSLRFQESLDLIILLTGTYRQTTIVIDALDESDAVIRSRFLSSLGTIIRSSTSLVKIFVSSRGDDDIVLRLEQVPNVYIEAKDNIGDIERFVHVKINRCIEGRMLLRGRVTEDLKKDVVSALVSGSHGMFLWVDLQIKEICNMSLESDVRERLGKLPQTLEKTYAEIYERVMLEKGSGPQLAKSALMWVMCSCRPFSPRELAAIVSLQTSGFMAYEFDMDVLFGLCHNLLTYDRQLNVVRFAHLSVREFFEKNHFDAVDTNSMAAEFCLSMLANPANRPADWGSVSGQHSDPVAEVIEYAVLYWPTHAQLCLGQQTNLRLPGLVAGFLESFTALWYRAAKAILVSKPYIEASKIPLYHDVSHLGFEPLLPLSVASLFGFGGEIGYLWESETWDVNCRNDHGESALYLASWRGYDWIVANLLSRGADVKTSGGIYGSALQAAAYSGHERVVTMLLESAADVNAQGGFHRNALQAAAASGNETVLEILLANGANVNAQGGNYGNALQAAAYGGHEKALGVLLRWGAAIDADNGLNQIDLEEAATVTQNGAEVEIPLKNNKNAGGELAIAWTALEAAAVEGDAKLVETLLDDSGGEDSSSQGLTYGNALRLAATAGNDIVMAILLENKAGVDSQASYYRTALQAAAAKGHDKAVEILLMNGADPNRHDNNYGNILQSGAYSGNERVVDMLLEHGAHPNSKGGFERSALEVAAAIGHEGMVKTLLKSGAEIDSQGAKYGNALQAAASSGHTKVMAIFLGDGIDVNAEGGECGNALRAAAMAGHYKAVEMLLANGADASLTGICGSALAAAVGNGHGKVVEILLAQEAHFDKPRRQSSLLTAAEPVTRGWRKCYGSRKPMNLPTSPTNLRKVFAG